MRGGEGLGSGHPRVGGGQGRKEGAAEDIEVGVVGGARGRLGGVPVGVIEGWEEIWEKGWRRRRGQGTQG